MNSLTKNKRLIGTLCGIAAAVCYGTNPLGALKLYQEQMTPNCVLFYRFSLAWVIIALVTIARKESLKITKKEFLSLTVLGLMFIISSLSLYLSFLYLAAGVASTILFVYPVMTAAIMALFFHERTSFKTIAAIILSLAGVVLLYWKGKADHLSPLGVVLVLISALSYAVYIIVMNRSQLKMSSFKINFYVLFYCALGMVIYSIATATPLTLPASPTSWFYVGWLAIVPAIFALVLMVYAAKYIGSTPTAILGALEPLTAVLIGIFVFNESFSLRLALGILLILSSVIIIALPQKRRLPSTSLDAPPSKCD